MPRGVFVNRALGARNGSWSDKKMISSQGYVRLRVGKEHPLADCNGYAYEHLVVWVSAGNQRPGPGLLLHHKNENRQDNRIENLELLTRSRHNRVHRQTSPRNALGRWVEQRA